MQYRYSKEFDFSTNLLQNQSLFEKSKSYYQDTSLKKLFQVIIILFLKDFRKFWKDSNSKSSKGNFPSKYGIEHEHINFEFHSEKNTETWKSSWEKPNRLSMFDHFDGTLQRNQQQLQIEYYPWIHNKALSFKWRYVVGMDIWWLSKDLNGGIR